MVTQSQLDEHYRYVTDASRMAQMRKAIAATVRPGDRVLDLACGTGILGLCALEAGAGHVTFVDETDMIEIARRSLSDTAHSGTCAFVRGTAQKVALPRDFDVVLCDNVGYLGIDYGILDMLHDAAARFLRPGGRMVPSRVRILAALLAEPPEAARRWTREDMPDEFAWVQDFVADTKISARLSEADLLGPPARLADLKLGEDPGQFVRGTAEVTPASSGAAHGLACWFEADLATGVTMTNRPGAPDAIDRSQALLPFGTPLAVAAGQAVALSLLARPADQVWTWGASVGNESRQQTTWRSMMLLGDMRQPEDAALRLRPEAEVRKRVLDLCDGHRTAGEIADAVALTCRDAYPTERALRDEVARLLALHSTAAATG